MKNLVFTLILLSPLLSLGQNSSKPFPRDSAIWVVHEFNIYEPGHSYPCYKLRGDTTVNDIPYKKVIRSFSFKYEIGDTLHCLMRFDSSYRKVFLKYLNTEKYPDTNEFILYDYSLEVGDSVFYKRKNSSSGITVVKGVITVIDFNGYVTSYYTNAGLPTPFVYMDSIGSDLHPFLNEIPPSKIDNTEVLCALNGSRILDPTAICTILLSKAEVSVEKPYRIFYLGDNCFQIQLNSPNQSAGISIINHIGRKICGSDFMELYKSPKFSYGYYLLIITIGNHTYYEKIITN